jgi:hypothetical protein
VSTHLQEITDQQLITLSREGFIPGPEESIDQFERRVAACRALRPQDEISELSSAHPEALTQVQTLFDVAPSWVPLVYSNRGMPPWQGAAACIAEASDNTDVVWIQLRRALRTRPRLWGLYTRDELIAHELAHVGRMAFNEPIFEELLAYRTASPWRRHWAALIQTPLEALLLLLAFLVASLANTLILFFVPTLYSVLFWLQLLPFGLIFYLILRLSYRQRQLNRCQYLLGLPLTYRLTDAEIIRFGRMERAEITAYATQAQSLRWRLLRAVYFK